VIPDEAGGYPPGTWTVSEGGKSVCRPSVARPAFKLGSTIRGGRTTRGRGASESCVLSLKPTASPRVGLVAEESSLPYPYQLFQPRPFSPNREAGLFLLGV
jgi:hypothetical protein